MIRSDAEEKINRLNEIYLRALSDESDSAFLCECLLDADYKVRSKAFFVAESCCDDAVWSTVFDIIQKGEREWQLRALNVICLHRAKEALPLLKDCLFQREKPLLIRGALLTVAEIGGKEALALVSSFLSGPFCGYLKPDFLGHCLFTAVEHTENGYALWKDQIGEDEQLKDLSARFLSERNENELLMVYPYPDYLSRMAEEQGIPPKEWKRLSYFPRRKKKAKE